MLPNWYSEYKNLIEHSLNKYLKDYFKNNTSEVLKSFEDIIIYSTRWGKKIRSILALEFYLSFTSKNLKEINLDDDIIKYCIALEIVHAFSLIHDDLPCMDNDTLRRWELTVWKKYWEANAVLAGDLLNTLAFEILSELSNPKASQQLSKLLSHAIWLYGMVWWQVEDIYFEHNEEKLTKELLEKLHNKKTWALIESSVLWGIILAEKQWEIDNYSSFWKKLGLAFQIKDDLLDVEWSAEEVGKSVWGEQKWFVHFVWLEQAKTDLNNLINNCLHAVKNLDSEKLDFIVHYIGERKK